VDHATRSITARTLPADLGWDSPRRVRVGVVGADSYLEGITSVREHKRVDSSQGSADTANVRVVEGRPDKGHNRNEIESVRP
jgi:hypothetical protein